MYDEEYYFIKSDGGVEVETESNSFCDDEHHKVANYCADRELTCQRNLHETLNRLLWRFSLENGGDSEWDGIECHWYITFQEGLVKRSQEQSGLHSGTIKEWFSFLQ